MGCGKKAWAEEEEEDATRISNQKRNRTLEKIKTLPPEKILSFVDSLVEYSEMFATSSWNDTARMTKKEFEKIDALHSTIMTFKREIS